MTRTLLALIVGAFTAALLSATAFAGEAKNQAPFTSLAAATPRVSLGGEPKNMVPFTHHVTPTRPAPDWFERYAAAHPYGQDAVADASAPITSAGGFHWPEALLGAAAATIACLLGVGLVVTRTRRRNDTAARDPLGA